MTARHKPDPNNPEPGDLVMARYRWSNQDQDNVQEKIRPCLVLKVGPNTSSVILVPISSHPDQKAGDCVEIPPQEQPNTCLDNGKRSWAKVTEVNRVELPNLAILPHADEHGRLQWRRGRVSPETLANIDREIGFRLHDKTLKGTRVAADQGAQIQLAAVRRAQRADTIKAKAAQSVPQTPKIDQKPRANTDELTR